MQTVKKRKLKYFGHTIRKSISGKGHHWRNEARIQSTWKNKDELYEQCYVMNWIKNRGCYQSSRWQRSLDRDCLSCDQLSYRGWLKTGQDRTPVTFNHQVLGQTLQFQHDWYEHSITQHWLTRWIVNAFRFWAFFRLDALALSVIATATWLAGWLGGCHTPVLYQNR